MNKLPETPRGFNPASVWWPLIREILLFTAGSVLLVVETTHASPRTPILLIGLLLLGLPIAGIFDRVLGGK